MKTLNTSKNRLFILITALSFVLTSATLLLAQIGIWTSASELADIPMSGCAWDEVLSEADAVDPNQADVSNQDSQNNVGILAAGIVYARTGTQSYKDKVVTACEKLVQIGDPGGNTLAWARETGAYVMAADLVGYRTTSFEDWCLNMAEVYVGSDNRTMLYMFKKRPNNWGAHGFGSLCAIYRYLGKNSRLNEIRNYWIQSVTGPKPDTLTYGDLCWQANESDPRRINPKGSTKSGVNVDGIIPDDMRRGGCTLDPPGETGYPWEFLQGEVMAARILDRAGLPIYATDDSALYRAVYALQVRLENQYGGWAATGDDEWQLPYWDEAYGTNYSDAYDPCTSRLYDHGKNAGWGYVTLGGGGTYYTLTVNTTGSGSVDLDPPGGSYLENTVVTLTANPEIGWVFDQWQGDLSSSANPETITMDADKNVTAVFIESQIPQYTLTINTAGSGSVDLNPPGGTYDSSTVVTLTANPDPGWAFDSWSGDLNGSANPETLLMDSNKSVTATFTPGAPVDDIADSDIAVKGTVSGSYTDTHTSNDVYESIQERQSGGKPANRYSYLEHKWTIDVTGGSSVTFYIEAYHTSNSEGDDFVFAYSTDDENYTNMVTVTKTSDDDTYQSYSLPSSLSGTVYVRVKDTDQTPGNKTLDIIYVDHMYIRSAAAKRSIPEEAAEVILPTEIRLHRNYPNPFNPCTTIRYTLSQSGRVKLAVYDMMGRTVSVLVDRVQNAGEYTHVWEAVDFEAKALPSGVYLCRLQVDSYVETMKMMLMR